MNHDNYKFYAVSFSSVNSCKQSYKSQYETHLSQFTGVCSLNRQDAEGSQLLVDDVCDAGFDNRHLTPRRILGPRRVRVPPHRETAFQVIQIHAQTGMCLKHFILMTGML